MNFQNFLPGIYTEAGETPGGESRAADSVNLRASKDGFLQHRVSTQLAKTPGVPLHAKINGVARISGVIFLNVEGTLYVKRDDKDLNFIRRNDVTDLSGRLSIIEKYETYTVLTSEGSDRGYIVEFDVEDSIGITPLSISTPTFNPNITARNAVNNEAHPSINKFYYYTFIYENDDADGLLDGLASKRSRVYRHSILSGSVDNAGKVRIITVEFPTAELDPKNSITKVGIYRSKDYDAAVEDYQEIPNADFRRIGEVAKNGSLTFEDTVNSTVWATGDVLVDDTGFPKTATSITAFSGYLWATCGDELRHNEVTALAPQPARWALSNSYKVIDNPITFAIPYFDRLLFGGRKGIHRLTGNSPQNFKVTPHISNRGALNTHCIEILNRGIAFIGESGFFLTDGTTVEDVSKSLDQFFKNTHVVDGFIIQFPNDDILFCAEFTTGDKRQFLFREVGEARTYESWDSVNIRQAIIQENSEVGITVNHGRWEVSGVSWVFHRAEVEFSIILYADNTDSISRLDWNDDDGSASADMVWTWESHPLFGKDTPNVMAIDTKLFRNLYISGKGNGEISVECETDEKTVTRQFTLNSLRRSKLLPIRLTGQYLKLKISGSGSVLLRGSYIEQEMLRKAVL